MGVVDGIIIDIFNRTSYPGTVCFENGVITQIKKADLNQLLSLRFSKKLPYILPPFIDSHLHIDMTFICPSQYAKLALSRGVAGALVESHDITAVLGRKGVEGLIENSKDVPFYFGFGAPSDTVPGIYSFDDIERLLKRDEVTHLGELKDFPSVILHEEKAEALFALAKKYNKAVDGHAPGLTGNNLKEYCNSSVSADHEVRSYEEGYEKIKAGLNVQIQTRDAVDFLSMKDLIENFPEKTMLCSEIVFGPNIKKKGYINDAAAKLVNFGCDVFNVLEAACVNPVKHYGLKSGLLRPGDSADFIVVDSAVNFNVLQTWVKGECVFDIENLNAKTIEDKLLKPSFGNIKAQKITADDLKISCPEEEVKLNVIDANTDEYNTVKSVFNVKSRNGYLESDIEKDILKVILVSRTKEKERSVAFIHGFGMKQGAFAMSITHDEHNFTCVGADDEDMAVAVNHLIDIKGGFVYASGGKVICEVPLSYGGIVSTKTSDELSEEYGKTHEVMRIKLGCTIRHPIRTLSYLFDTTIPSLKMNLKGLFSVAEQEQIPLWT